MQPTFAGVRVTHPERVIFPAEGLTKLDLHLRNNRTNTSVAAYSARARAGAPVSIPIAWDELSPRFNPARWTIRTLPRRLKSLDDPWAAYFKTKQKLPV